MAPAYSPLRPLLAAYRALDGVERAIVRIGLGIALALTLFCVCDLAAQRFVAASAETTAQGSLEMMREARRSDAAETVDIFYHQARLFRSQRDIMLRRSDRVLAVLLLGDGFVLVVTLLAITLYRGAIRGK